RICGGLDGLPLANEMAAARLRTLTLPEIADRSADRIRLLTSQRRLGSERHQTLRAVVDWSWDLLEPIEQVLLRRLAVFAGACDLAAVEGCCAGLGGADDVPADQVLEVLSALVDRSLAVIEPEGGRTVYRLLETVRAYGLDRLRESGEEEATRQAHARFHCDLAEAAAPHLRDREQVAWLERLDIARAELRAAIQWAIRAGRKEPAVRLGTALSWYCGLRGLRERHREWLTAALAIPGSIAPLQRAQALTSLVSFGVNPDVDPPRDQETIAEARVAFAEAGLPPSGELLLREMAGWLGRVRGDPAEGERLSADLASLRHDPVDPWVQAGSWAVEAFSLTTWAPPEERRARVEAAFEHGVEGYRQVGDDWGLAGALTGLAVCTQARGDGTSAAAHLDEAFSRAGRIGWSEDVVWVLIGLTASLAVREGSMRGGLPGTETDGLLQRGLEQAQALGTSALGVAAGYVFLGATAQRRGATDLAARCFSLALAQEVREGSQARTPMHLAATAGLAWAREREGDTRAAWEQLGRASEVLRAFGAQILGRRPAGDGANPELRMTLGWLAGCCRIGARVQLRAGDGERTLMLLGAARGLLAGTTAEERAQVAESWPPDEVSDEELERRGRVAVGAEHAEAALARGAAMPPRDVHAALEGWELPRT
ncbi:MAG: ATP-binding protein, partial [Steroidobacteraceae bacterium]